MDLDPVCAGRSYPNECAAKCDGAVCLNLTIIYYRDPDRVVAAVQLSFLCNRLALIMCYLLDDDLALFSLLLLWKVKSNKSWNTFFAIKVLFHVHDIIQPFATFQYQLQ